MTTHRKGRTRAHLLFIASAFGVTMCSPAAPKEEAAAAPVAAEQVAEIKPSKTGYADVNGLKIYHEIYGQGDPLVVLHGGLMTIPETQALIQPLAKNHQVIAVEQQGHGRTADTDRPFTLNNLGDDVAGLLDYLQIPKADVVGYSMGADAAIRAAIQHPEKVDRLVVISTPFKRTGWHREALDGMSQVGAAMAPGMMETPTGKFSKEWPEPQRFPQLLDKLGKEMAVDYDWSADIRKLEMPVLLMFADHDSVSQAHIAEFFALLGGGNFEPGWQDTKFIKSRLAIIPGYSHYNFLTAPEVPVLVGRFLDGKMEGTPGFGAPPQN